MSTLVLQIPTENGVWKMEQLPKSKSPLSAIHKIICHIWEDRSRKVNNDEPDLRFFHGNFRPVISQAVRKPCFSTSIPRGPNLYPGPTHLGPAWAHPRGPSLGPPTWAQLGPTHLGPPIWISRRRRRTNSQIQIQAPPNAPRDEILPPGNPRC